MAALPGAGGTVSADRCLCCALQQASGDGICTPGCVCCPGDGPPPPVRFVAFHADADGILALDDQGRLWWRHAGAEEWNLQIMPDEPRT